MRLDWARGRAIDPNLASGLVKTQDDAMGRGPTIIRASYRICFRSATMLESDRLAAVSQGRRRAKYLNPGTPLFRKGGVLFGLTRPSALYRVARRDRCAGQPI